MTTRQRRWTLIGMTIGGCGLLGFGCQKTDDTRESAAAETPNPPDAPAPPAGTPDPPWPRDIPIGGELCGLDVRCKDGVIQGVVGNGCRRLVERCELGCRTDQGPEPRLQEGGSEESATERSHALCEEYRLSHGPRRPGDACQREYDCLSYPESTPPQGLPWPRLMRCIQGTCQEAAALQTTDYGASCVEDHELAAPSSSVNAMIVGSACDSSLCIVGSGISAANGTGVCTMQCIEDADCPSASNCRGLPLGIHEDFRRAAWAMICTETRPLPIESPTPDPDAGSAPLDAGTGG